MLQSVLDGLVAAVATAVLAAAFSLVLSTTRVFFVALGVFYAAAPYVYLTCVSGGVPAPLAAVAAVASGAVLSALAELTLHWPLERRHSSPETHVIASLGVFLMLSQLIGLTWGVDSRFLLPGLDRTFEVAGLRLTEGQLVVLATCLGALVLVALAERRSFAGLELRGLASNGDLLSLTGRNVRLLRLLAFSVAGCLAAASGTAVARDVGFEPGSGMKAVLAAAAAALVGGRGSLAGVVVASLLLGLLRGVLGWFSAAEWEEAVVLMIAAIAVVAFPGGLAALGRGGRRPEEAR